MRNFNYAECSIHECHYTDCFWLHNQRKEDVSETEVELKERIVQEHLLRQKAFAKVPTLDLDSFPGVDPTGTTECAAAINAALSSKGMVFLQNGKPLSHKKTDEHN